MHEKCKAPVRHKMQRNFVAVSGYGWSGSSAVVDLLKEFKGYTHINTEFRLLKDPYGITRLESILVDNWDILTSDIAIKDFLWLAESLNRNPSFFSIKGMSYEKKLCKDFLKLTNEYIKSLLICEYKGYWSFFDMKRSHYNYIFKKIKNRLGFNVENETMFLSKPSKDTFVAETKQYLHNIFDAVETNGDNSKIILDQTIPLPYATKALRYFDSIKMIIVDRDPRDIYIDLISHKTLIGKELSNGKNAHKFIEWHKALHIANSELTDDRILAIQFEDLIFDYKNVKDRIIKFLGEPDSIHVNKKKYFDPDVSMNNVGIWKKFNTNTDDIKRIEKSLHEYCYKQN
jgi:hypothetical protein